MLKQLSEIFTRSNKVSVQSSDVFYRQVFENSQDGILLVDAETGVIIEANSYIFQLFGYEEFVGKKIWEIDLLNNIIPNMEAFEGLRTNRTTRYENLPLQTKDGLLIKVTFISNVYEAGEKRIVQCNIREFTQGKAISEALKSQNVLLENAQKTMIKMIEDLDQAKKEIEREKVKGDALVLSIGDGVVATDQYGRITVVNSAARRMLGWSFQEVYGKPLVETLELEDSEGKPLLVDVNSSFTSEVFCIRKDKTKLPIAINIKAITWSNKGIGVVITFRDITQEKEIDRIKSEFISIATHQLKTPIAGMRWSLQLLDIPEEKLSDQQKTHLKNVTNFVEVLGSTVNDMLNVSRIELGTQNIDLQDINLLEYIYKFLEEIKPYVETSKRTITLTGIENARVALSTDIKLLHGIFQNLISNAVEYSDPGTEVVVDVLKEENFLKISISNIGEVISEAARPHMFEKFYRAAEAKKVKEGGTGMGLYIVKLFVEKLGGRVGFESEDHKTVFWFTLPLNH